MNITPFANFGNFESQSELFAEIPTSETTEDFSAILTNIISVVNTNETPVTAVEADSADDESGFYYIELPPCDNTPLDKKLSDNNLLEIPPVEAKTMPVNNPTEKTNPVSFENLWAGEQNTIRQRINDYKFETSVKEQLKNQIKNLFPTGISQQPAPPSQFIKTEEIPADVFPELQTMQNAAQTEEGANVSPLFQAEKYRIVKTDGDIEKKPVKNDISLTDKSPNYMPEPIYVALETDVLPNSKSLPRVEFQNQEIPNQTPEILPGISEITIEDFPRETPKMELPKISIKPEIENGRIKGFDITPNEVSTILKSFEKFFKTDNPPIKVVGPLDKNYESAETGGFEEISKSIRDSFATIMNPSETDFQPQKPQVVQTANLWAGNQKPVDDDGKIIINETVTQKKLRQVLIPPPVVNQFQAESPESANQGFKLKSLDANAEIPFKFENSQFQTETIKNEEIDLNAVSRFDKFLENVSKEKMVTADFQATQIEPKKILEQINPQLLKLAASAVEKSEKQFLKMRLHPAELGMVEIRVERTEHGLLNAYFHADNERAQQVLSHNIEHLREALQNAGWQVGQTEVSFSSGSSGYNEQRENPSRQSIPVESNFFSRTSETPDASESKPQNRLLSLLA